LLLAREGLLVSHLASPNLGQVLAWVNVGGAADEGSKEAIKLF
jgi:hypothetical protein